jgi:hypothetical protein
MGRTFATLGERNVPRSPAAAAPAAGHRLTPGRQSFCRAAARPPSAAALDRLEAGGPAAVRFLAREGR